MIQLRNLIAICSFTVVAIACLPQNKDKGGNPAPALADANCGTRTTTNCSGNTSCQVSGTQCVGTSTYCSSYQNEEGCPGSSCQWSISSKSCSPIVPYIPPSNDATASTNCGSFYQASTCPTPACVWNGVQCLASETSANNNNPNNTNPNNNNPTTGQPPMGSAVCDAIQYDWWKCTNTPGCQYYVGLPPKLGCHAAGLSW
jgi:hypothetical protein